MTTLLAEQMLVLFAILAIGSLIGQWSWRGISLGTAGVLFVALVFGHFGLKVPQAIMDLGLLLFVYAVGITAGPRFFRTFKKHGVQFVVITLVTIVVGALATIGVTYLFHLPYDLAAGLYAGGADLHPCTGIRGGCDRKVDPRRKRQCLRRIWDCISLQHDRGSPADPVSPQDPAAEPAY